MKKIKFKRNHFYKLDNVFLTVGLIVIQILILCSFFINHTTDRLADYVSSKVRKENLVLLKSAFETKQYNDNSNNNLISIIKNSNDEIVEVDFDMDKAFLLLSDINRYINFSTDNYNFNGYRLDTPIGSITNHPMFINIGPKIPIKIELSDTALGNIRTEVKSFGINSALIELYIDITIRTSVIFPTKSLDREDTYTTLISSKIISGKVPDFWGGTINSKSEDIELPKN